MIPASVRLGAIFLLLFLISSCGSKAPQGSAETKLDPSEGYYSAKAGFRVVYPSGTEAGPGRTAEGNVFRIRSGDATLQGEISVVLKGSPDWRNLSAAERAEQSIAELGSPATYKAVKPGWYVFSGTRGDQIVYEKGLVHGNFARLRVTYPIAKKDAFNSVVANLSNSFTEFLVVTGKAGVITGDDDEAGLMFVNDVPDDSINQLTTCSIDVKDRAKFNELKEGQEITVGGQPEFVNVRAQTAENAGVDHRQLNHCVILNGRP